MGTEMAAQQESRESDSSLAHPGGDPYFSSKEFRSLLKNLTKSHDMYMHMKTSLYGQKGSGFGLDLCEVDLTRKIETLVSPKERDPLGRDAGPASHGQAKAGGSEDIGEKRKLLKEKFFGSGSVESHRDRLLADRSRESETSDEEKKEVGEQEDWLPAGRKLLAKKKGRGRGRKCLNLTSPEKGDKVPRGRGKGRGSRGSRAGARSAKRGRKAKGAAKQTASDSGSDWNG